jgi:hypothetical protein
MTECNDERIDFQALGSRDVVAQFNGGRITSDGGVLLLRELEDQVGFIQRLADCFEDHRDPERIEHTVEELLRQRIFGLILGYEDLNDHDDLRRDSALAAACGKPEPEGQDRRQPQDEGKALAGKSTLNRLELGAADGGSEQRYKRIEGDVSRLEECLFDLWVDLLARRYPDGGPDEIVLDADASDIQLHGGQEGRHYQGYYDGYCYLPLYVFQGEWLIASWLRTSDQSASGSCRPSLELAVDAIQTRWPDCTIVLRADSDFSTPTIFEWCETWEVDYIFGLRNNPRLYEAIEDEMNDVQTQAERAEDGTARRYVDFDYQTLESWDHARRVVAKVEYTEGEANPRFVVTSRSREEASPETVYCEEYCARGESENRIKEVQLGLFGTRTSTRSMESNQCRVFLSSIAYLLVCALRSLGLEGTPWANLQTSSIRTKLLKIGALVCVSTRRVWLKMASSYPYQSLFREIVQRIRAP